MLSKLFPDRIDNLFRGHWIGLCLYAPLLFIKLAMGINSIVNTRVVAGTVDGIPLDKFAGGGAEAVMAFFAVWGLGQVLLASWGVLVLFRYRAMVPLVFLFMLLEQAGRKIIFMLHPIETALAADRVSPGLINLGILAAIIIGLGLSLLGRSGAAESSEASLHS